MRNFFASTLAIVAQATGTTLAFGLTQAVTGGLTDWFSRKTKASMGGQPGFVAPAPFPPAPGAAAAPPVFPPAAAGTAPPVFTSPPPTAPAFPPPTGAATAPVFPPPDAVAAPPVFAPAVAAPQFFDAKTGAAVAPDPGLTTRETDQQALFAGLAFEVHAVLAGGATEPVNPATHEFRTGDRFVVHYRPTMPGRVEVYNVNPLGVQAQIDSVESAGAQLATLGPYEFAATTGEDRLRIVLTPCSSPQLLAATRDIVRVEPAAATDSDLRLAACGPAMRSARTLPTRDIRKVAVENNTGFALDPVSAAERSSGQLAPREVTIVFRHR